VRELRNVLERAVVLARAGWIEPGHLPPYLRNRVPGGEPTLTIPVGITAAEAERRLILRTLELVGQNKAEAARCLGIDVKTLRSRLKAYGSAGAPGSPGEDADGAGGPRRAAGGPRARGVREPAG
jgi:DNA-binding NtrC family response regulator